MYIHYIPRRQNKPVYTGLYCASILIYQCIMINKIAYKYLYYSYKAMV